MTAKMTMIIRLPPLVITANFVSIAIIAISSSIEVVHPFQVAGPVAATFGNIRHSHSIATTTTTTFTSPLYSFQSLFAVNSSSDINLPSPNINKNNNINDYVSMTTLPRHPSNHNVNEILSKAEHALQLMHEEVLASYASSSSATDDDDDDDDIIINMLSQKVGGNGNEKNSNSIVVVQEDDEDEEEEDEDEDCLLKNLLTNNMESVYANSYVDLGKVDTVGFDFDYTLVTYTTELLSLIYDMSLKRLVQEKEYPREMLTAGLKFDPFFSIRGEF